MTLNIEYQMANKSIPQSSQLCAQRGMDTRGDYAVEPSTLVETIQGVRSELAVKLKSNKGYRKALRNAFRYIF